MAIDKNAVVKDAQKYVAKGQFDKAIAEWKKLLRETPDDPNIYNTIGDLCLKKNAKTDAVEAYKRAADLLAADGFTSKAIALYKKVLNIDPQKIDVYLTLGDLNAEKGLTGAALESYKVVADHYIQQNNMPRALGIYQKMADMSPANHTFRIKLGDMYAKEGMKTDAAKAYLDAADAYMAKNDFQEARQLFEKVLVLDPHNKGVYHKAGLVYFKEGKFVEACKTLKPAFEDNPSNQELADTYLEALQKAGKTEDAENALILLIAKNADRPDLHEKLYQLYLSIEDFEKALGEVAALAQMRRERNEDEEAEALLKAFIAQVPRFVPARLKLAEFYASNFRNNDAATELLLAAELLAEEDVDGAKALLSRALAIVPNLPEAKQLLESLEAASAAPQPSAHAEMLSEEMPEPAPLAAPEPEAFGEPTRPAAPIEEEAPAVDEAFTEADVLIKYGLPAKAMEQLETLANQYPENARIRIKLRDLAHEQNNTEQTVRQSLLLSDIYLRQGDRDAAEAALQTALEWSPNDPTLLSRIGLAPADTAAQPIETAPDSFELTETIPEIATSAFEETPSILEPPPAADDTITFEPMESSLSPLEEPAPVEEPLRESPLFEETTQSRDDHPLPEIIDTPIFEGLPAFEAPSGRTENAPKEILPETDLNELWAEAEFYYQQGLFDEARKHYAKIIELSPSDRRAIERLTEISREEDETREFTKLAEAVEGLEEEGTLQDSGDGALAVSASDDEAVSRLMREISEVNKEQKPKEQKPKEQKPVVPPPLRKEPAQPMRAIETSFSRDRQPAPPANKEIFGGVSKTAKGPAHAEEDFFDLGEALQKEVAAAARDRKKKSEDFFDLAAELKDELSAAAVDRPPVAPENQSLDDIFEEFKKGVEQQAVKEDADTHYNLGVAYKEMGLLDDAVAEFIMTPEDEPRFVQSRYMLGLCYMEKGDFQSAIGEIQNAIDYTDTIGSDDDTHTRLGMQYDLALAYQSVGNLRAALAEFQKISDANPGYRDIAAKLQELNKGDFLSLAQLKQDIEKEISSKFLQEGARIEREEKIRRSEKTRQ